MRRLELPIAGVTAVVIEHGAELREAVREALNAAPLPQDRDAAILLKPNLNSDLNSLVGNSTDLRVLKSLLQGLQARGYRRLGIADGPNYGICRLGIDVAARLGVRRLCESLGVEWIDLNQTEGRAAQFSASQTHLAAPILDAALVLNIPKIKTHADAGYSSCLKNLVGVAVGASKRRIHDDLARHIVDLNRAVQPAFHFVDGLVAMEGNGPNDGTPVWANLLAWGANPFLLDCVTARLVGFDRLEEIPYLEIARQEGLISAGDWTAAHRIAPVFQFRKANAPGVAGRMLKHPKLAAVRDLLRPIFSKPAIMKMLLDSGLVQDAYDTTEPNIRSLRVDPSKCGDCCRCEEFCPAGWARVRECSKNLLESSECLGCLYCYWLCPRDAVTLDGDLGYLKARLAKYGEVVRKMKRRLGEPS